MNQIDACDREDTATSPSDCGKCRTSHLSRIYLVFTEAHGGRQSSESGTASVGTCGM